MKIKKMIATTLATALFLSFIVGKNSAASTEEQLDQEKRKKKCEELIKNSKDASPDLYTAVLNCELNTDDSFAAASDFGGDLGSARQLLTGSELPLNNAGTPSGGGDSTPPPGDTTPGTGTGGGTGGGGTGGGGSGGGCVPAPGHPCGGPGA